MLLCVLMDKDSSQRAKLYVDAALAIPYICTKSWRYRFSLQGTGVYVMKCPIGEVTAIAHLGRPVSIFFRKIFLLFLLIASGAAIFPSAHGQATGSFSGTVTDKSGSNIPGASITATSQATGLARTGKADEAGHYLIPLLPVGLYTVNVSSSGFQSVESKGLNLDVNQALELNFTLSPASVSTTVEVSANAVAAETTNSSLGQVITSQEVSQLPLNGRDFVQLATLTSGATAETTASSPPRPAVR
jgi:hypothetical protein